MSAQTQAEPVFALYAQAYLDAGWPCVLPVPAETKSPPPEGFTGEAGQDTDPATLAVWAQSLPYHSVALRMPAGIIGIDVDHYPKGKTQKVGGQTLAALEAVLGPLPPTWISSARPAPSGIRFYRVPPGRYATKLVSPDGSTGDIEVIQRHHRYAVVAPSHHEVGAYQWQHPTGTIPGSFVPGPSPGELPELPAAWVEHLREGSTSAGPAAAPRDAGDQLLSNVHSTPGQPCRPMTDAITKATAAMGGTNAGTRHDITIERVHHIVMLAAHGHPGIGMARDQLARLWEDLTAGEQRAAEFDRMWTTSARKAVTEIGGVTPRGHVTAADGRCDSDLAKLAAGGLDGSHAGVWSQLGAYQDTALHGAATVLESNQNGHNGTNSNHVSPEVGSPNAAYFAKYGPPATTLSGVVGDAPFDPSAAFDQDIAAAVLERTTPVLRWARDSRTWLSRQNDGRWSTDPDGHRGMIDYLANLAPAGDAAADKGTPEQQRAARRARLKANAGAGAVAGKMRSLTAIPGHPSVVELSKLDADPVIFWAGRLPWDLRACIERLKLADVGWAEPHTHDAGILPVEMPTPAWDAFCAAVWPDPSLRAWALRVLSIGLTGIPDAALIILTGETGRGKSSMAQLMLSALGSYGNAVHRSLLFGDNSSEKHVHELKGLRMAFIDESPHGTRGSTEHLKQITGGGTLSANDKYEKTYQFEPTHTLVLTSNHDPELSDPALLRRVRLVPCIGDPATVTATRRALTPAVWQAERPGVLAAMMREAAAWLAEPVSGELSALPALEAYVHQLAEEDDPYRGWLDDAVVPDEAGMPSRDLYRNFRQWWLDGGLSPKALPTETAWGRQLTKRGYPVIKHREANYRPLILRGIRGLVNQPGQSPGTTLEALADQVGSSLVGTVHTPESNPPQPTSLPEATVNNPPTVHKPPTDKNPGQTLSVDTVEGMEGKSKKEWIEERKGHKGTKERGVSVEGKESNPQPPETSKPSTQADPQSPVGPPTDPMPRDPDALALRITQGDIQASQGKIESLELPARLAFDLETDKAGELYRTPSGQFTLLGGLTDLEDREAGYQHTQAFDALVAGLPGAQVITGHNIWGYDFQVLARHHKLDLLALDPDRTIDTEILVRHIDPPMARDKGVDADRRYDLDSLGERLGLGGKQGSISDIARKHKGYGNIPADDPELLDYQRRDVLLQAAVLDKLEEIRPGVSQETYVRREHRIYQRAAVMSANGFVVDTKLLADRLADQALRKGNGYRHLAEQHQIPYESASPLATKDGKAALEQAFLRLGVPLEMLPRTDKTGVITAGGDAMRELAATINAGAPGHPAAELAEQVAALSGERTIYQTVRDNLVPGELAGDGLARVHPKISFRQASGRASFTSPGLTVFGKHGERWHEREVLLPDPGHVMISIDLSQVDMRALAAQSQDRAYMALFEPGRDAHAEIAAMLGLARDDAKAAGHGWNYGLGIKAMVRDGIPFDVATRFDEGMRSRFPGLIDWREGQRALAASGALLDNGWGRLMRPDPRRAHTQAPALKGQGGARDIMWEGVLRVPEQLLQFLRGIVHDEILVSAPIEHARDIEAMIIQALTFEWLGVPILAAGQTWKLQDGSTVPAYGNNWGQCYAKTYPE